MSNSSNNQDSRDPPAAKRQSHADFWREQQEKGLTPSQFRGMLNSLPRIVPLNLPTKPPSK